MSAPFEDLRGPCPHCGWRVAFTLGQRMQVAPRHVQLATGLMFNPRLYKAGEAAAPTPQLPSDEVLVLWCQGCHENTVLLDHWEEDPADPGTPKLISREIVYPEQSPRDLPAAAPADLRSLYQEASKCAQTGALRGAGVLYRAATERLVEDQGGTGKDLYAKIESLRPTLGVELVDALHQSRIMGNESIHQGLEFAPEEVEDIAELIDEAVYDLYAVPAERQVRRNARLARVAARKASTPTP